MTRTKAQDRAILLLLESPNKADRSEALVQIRAAIEAAHGKLVDAAKTLGIAKPTFARVMAGLPDLAGLAAELRVQHGIPGYRQGIEVDPEDVRKALAKGQPVPRSHLQALSGVSRAAISGLVQRGRLVEGEDGITASSAREWLESRGVTIGPARKAR